MSGKVQVDLRLGTLTVFRFIIDVCFNHRFDDWIMHDAAKEFVDGEQEGVDRLHTTEMFYFFNATIEHVEVVSQFGIHEKFDLGVVGHEVATLNILHLLKNERYQAYNELVDELLLLLNLLHRILHEEAYLLKN